jgi:hypothetical protein
MAIRNGCSASFKASLTLDGQILKGSTRKIGVVLCSDLLTAACSALCFAPKLHGHQRALCGALSVLCANRSRVSFSVAYACGCKQNRRVMQTHAGYIYDF